MKKICIIGVGLIGGAIGIDVKRLGLAQKVVGVVRRQESIQESIKQKAVDEATLSLSEGVRDADMVIIATQISSIIDISKKIIGNLKEGAVVIDVGSIKGKLVDSLDNIFGDKIHYVGTHQMAGSEKKGVLFAHEDMFKDATCVITPTKKTNTDALNFVNDFWEKLGANIVTIPAGEHDKVVAMSSHLPHVIAASLVNLIRKNENVQPFIGPGFKDTTRIAGSTPVIWKDICQWNKDEILKSIEEYKKELSAIQETINCENWDELLKKLDSAKETRDSL